MSKRLIYEEDAIDAVAEGLKRTFVEYRDVAEKMLNKVPSAQPETEERTAESAQNVPKDELISKKAAIEAVLDRCPSDYDSEYECGYYDALKEAVPMLIHVPSVQPQRMRGRWEYLDYGGVGNYHCSACRRICINKGDYAFCPFCGADMRGKE